MKRNKKMLKEMIEHFGAENIPDPRQYPKRFEFLTKSFEFHRQMKERKAKSTEVAKSD